MKAWYRTTCVLLLLSLLCALPFAPARADAVLTVTTDKASVAVGEEITIFANLAGAEADTYEYQIWITEGDQTSQISGRITSETQYTFRVNFGDSAFVDVGASKEGKFITSAEASFQITGGTPHPLSAAITMTDPVKGGKPCTFAVTASGGVPPYRYLHQVGIRGSDYWQTLYSGALEDDPASITLTMPKYGTDGTWTVWVQDSEGRLLEGQSRSFTIPGNPDKPLGLFLELFVKKQTAQKYTLTARGSTASAKLPMHYRYVFETWDSAGKKQEVIKEGDNMTKCSIVCENQRRARVTLSGYDAYGRVAFIFCIAETDLPSDGVSILYPRPDLLSTLITQLKPDPILGRIVYTPRLPRPADAPALASDEYAADSPVIAGMVTDIGRTTMVTSFAHDGKNNTLTPILNPNLLNPAGGAAIVNPGATIPKPNTSPSQNLPNPGLTAPVTPPKLNEPIITIPKLKLPR